MEAYPKLSYDALQSMVLVQIYTKHRCCLCDEAKLVLQRMRGEIPFDLLETDIETDPGLLARYGEQIPVVFVAGHKAFKYRIDEHELRRKLARAQRQNHEVVA